MGLASLPLVDSQPLQLQAAAPGPAPTVEAPTAPIAPGAKVITTPVRSGQQVWAQGQDLILLGAVSAGAEVMADGNVHCYGVLRGRIAAGVSGDPSARIFARRLEAQVASVAGVFMAEEELSATAQWGKSALISLVDDRLHMTGLPEL